MIKRLLEKLEAALAAVAFAEEGDAETARRIMDEAGSEDLAERREDHADSHSPFRPRARMASGS